MGLFLGLGTDIIAERYFISWFIPWTVSVYVYVYVCVTVCMCEGVNMLYCLVIATLNEVSLY